MAARSAAVASLTAVREPGSSVAAWSAAGASPTAVREPGSPVAARSAAGASPTAAREPWSSVAAWSAAGAPPEAAGDDEIFFVELVLAYEMEPDEEDDENPMDLSWIDQPWTEMEELEWCGRAGCREVPVAAQGAARVSPTAVEAGALTVRDGEAAAAIMAARRCLRHPIGGGSRGALCTR